jgi:hypothetical protein
MQHRVPVAPATVGWTWSEIVVAFMEGHDLEQPRPLVCSDLQLQMKGYPVEHGAVIEIPLLPSGKQVAAKGFRLTGLGASARPPIPCWFFCPSHGPAMSAHALLPAVNRLLQQVEETSGVPVVVARQSDLSSLATMRPATPERQAHLIAYRDANEASSYHVAFETALLLRIVQVPGGLPAAAASDPRVNCGSTCGQQDQPRPCRCSTAGSRPIGVSNRQ